MYRHIRQLDLRGKKALVVGCGFGFDAMSLALMGAEVSAFDLSIDELEVAAKTAAEAGLTIEFQQMEIARNSVESRRPSETIDYATATPFAKGLFETAFAIEDSSIGIWR